MTPPVDDPEALRQILANTEALLLDFDGPICSVFAGIPAPIVADQLRNVLAEGGHNDLPDDVRHARDPFDVLFYAAKLGAGEAHYVEAAFRAHEVEAVQSAEPTPGAVELMAAWKNTGKPLAIVSNNSVEAVRTYLDLRDLQARFDYTSARSNADVSTLKPSPYLVIAAAREIDTHTLNCTLLGDSLTDIEAAQAAGASAIGFANKIGKVEQFTQTDLDAIVSDLALLLPIG